MSRSSMTPNKKVLDQGDSAANFDPTTVIGEGMLRKNNTSGWCQRKYALTLDGYLFLIDPISRDVNASLSVSACIIQNGESSGVLSSGANKQGFALKVNAIEDSLVWDLVFENKSQAKTFIKYLDTAARDHSNIDLFCSAQGWDDVIPVNDITPLNAPSSSMFAARNITASGDGDDSVVGVETVQDVVSVTSNVDDEDKPNKEAIGDENSISVVASASKPIEDTASSMVTPATVASESAAESTSLKPAAKRKSSKRNSIVPPPPPPPVEGKDMTLDISSSPAAPVAPVAPSPAVVHAAVTFVEEKMAASSIGEVPVPDPHPAAATSNASAATSTSTSTPATTGKTHDPHSSADASTTSTAASVSTAGRRGSTPSTAPDDRVVGEGLFRKLHIMHWYQHKYVIYRDSRVKYFDISSGKEKGTFSLKNITISKGKSANIDNAGSISYGDDAGYALVVKNTPSSALSNSTLDIVFDSLKECKLFVGFLSQVAHRGHNLREFSAQEGWSTVNRNPNSKSGPITPNKPTPSSSTAAGAGGGASEPCDTRIPRVTSAPTPPVTPLPQKSSFRRASIAASNFLTAPLSRNVPVPTGLILGEGVFRKQGSSVKSWRKRRYTITEDHQLTYYEPDSDVLKGSLSAKNVYVSLGAPENLVNSGTMNSLVASTDHHTADPMALDVKSMTDNRTLEMVFDMREDAIIFVKQLSKATLKDNIPTFVQRSGWHIDVSKARNRTNVVPARKGTLDAPFTTLVQQQLPHVESPEAVKSSNTVMRAMPITMRVVSVGTFTFDNVLIDMQQLLLVLWRNISRKSHLPSLAIVTVWWVYLCYVWSNPSVMSGLLVILYAIAAMIIVLRKESRHQKVN